MGSLLRWSYRIGFLIAGIAGIIFLATTAHILTFDEKIVSVAQTEPSEEERRLRRLREEELERQLREAEASRWTPTVVISGLTLLGSTITGFSTMWLAWRLDRRQSQETAVRTAQLQIEVERSRQVKVEQS
jgi:hypothetical protein